MQNLKITVIQPNIIWENPQANLEKYSEWIETIEETDLIILPEMFTTGFSMEPEKLKEMVSLLSNYLIDSKAQMPFDKKMNVQVEYPDKILDSLNI